MKETQTEAKQVVETADFFTRAELFIEANKKPFIIGVSVILVAVLAFFAIKKWYVEPREVAAAEEAFVAENFFDAGQYEYALNGSPDLSAMGFVDIIDEYGSTKVGNLARYYAGVCELRLGHYDEAANYFKKYKGKDTFTKGLALVGQGDAELELGNDSEALSLYLKAAKKADNDIVAPTALFKAGMVYIKLGEGDKAVAVFEQIKERYPRSTEYNNVDQYIAYAQQL